MSLVDGCILSVIPTCALRPMLPQLRPEVLLQLPLLLPQLLLFPLLPPRPLPPQPRLLLPLRPLQVAVRLLRIVIQKIILHARHLMVGKPTLLRAHCLLSVPIQVIGILLVVFQCTMEVLLATKETRIWFPMLSSTGMLALMEMARSAFASRQTLAITLRTLVMIFGLKSTQKIRPSKLLLILLESKQSRMRIIELLLGMRAIRYPAVVCQK